MTTPHDGHDRDEQALTDRLHELGRAVPGAPADPADDVRRGRRRQRRQRGLAALGGVAAVAVVAVGVNAMGIVGSDRAVPAASSSAASEPTDLEPTLSARVEAPQGSDLEPVPSSVPGVPGVPGVPDRAESFQPQGSGSAVAPMVYYAIDLADARRMARVNGVTQWHQPEEVPRRVVRDLRRGSGAHKVGLIVTRADGAVVLVVAPKAARLADRRLIQAAVTP